MNTPVFIKVMRKIAGLILVLALLVPLTTAAHPQSQKASYIVRGVDADVVGNLVSAAGGLITSHLEVIDSVGAMLSNSMVADLLEDPGIFSIVPNSSVRVAGSGNDDPAPATDYPELVGADVVWEAGVTGEGVTVAVVDTGLSNHPGLLRKVNGVKLNRIAAWADFVGDTKSPTDPNGHGTHIAGIIANAQKGPDGEWNGVAPGVRLVGVRVLDENGFSTYETVVDGIEWVIENKNTYNIRVMNLSLVSPATVPYWLDPINQAVMQAWANGITVVVAAGNYGPNPMTIGVPGNNPYVITVGAFTDNLTPDNWNDDYLTPFSSAGPTMDAFAKPDVLAPGSRMVSTMDKQSTLLEEYPDNSLPHKYFSMAGTSQASAVVSGLAALTLAKNPDLTPDQVKYRLMVTAFPWINVQENLALYSLWQQGAGRVNAPDAVLADIDGVANYGLNVEADIEGSEHFIGFTYIDETTGEFRLRDEFSDWAGGYGAWAGNYEAQSGGYGAWAGGYGAWAGGYGAWAGGYGAWAGGYGAWAGGYGAWAGGYGAWAGGYGAWAGGYGAWAGGDVAWAGGDGAWAGGDGPWVGAFTEQYFSPYTSDEQHPLPWSGNWVDFDG